MVVLTRMVYSSDSNNSVTKVVTYHTGHIL